MSMPYESRRLIRYGSIAVSTGDQRPPSIPRDEQILKIDCLASPVICHNLQDSAGCPWFDLDSGTDLRRKYSS